MLGFLECATEFRFWRTTPGGLNQPARPLLALDLTSGEIETIVWAPVSAPTTRGLDVPALDRKGPIRHNGGVVHLVESGGFLLRCNLARGGSADSSLLEELRAEGRSVISSVCCYQRDMIPIRIEEQSVPWLRPSADKRNCRLARMRIGLLW